MRARLPALGGRAVIAALERAVFYVHHVKGSHRVLRHSSKPRDLPPGTLRAIIKQAGLTVDELLDLL